MTSTETKSTDGISTIDESRDRNVYRRIFRVLLQNYACRNSSGYFLRHNRGVGVVHCVGVGAGENVGK